MLLPSKARQTSLVGPKTKTIGRQWICQKELSKYQRHTRWDLLKGWYSASVKKPKMQQNVGFMNKKV